MSLSNAIQKLRSVQSFDINRAVADIINENGEYVSNLLRNQLKQGIDGRGEPITLKRKGGIFPYYSAYTEFKKTFKGQETGFITFHDTGVFYSSIYVFASQNTFLLDSDVPYFPDILVSSGSGDAIMELTQQNLELLSTEIIGPQLKIRFDAATNV